MRLHTEKPLQLELSEDIQSALKDSDVDGVLINEPTKIAKVNAKRKECKRKGTVKKNIAVTSNKIKFILPKPN